MKFTDEQISALKAPLDRNRVKTRSQGGRELSYVEGWVVIDEANRIFGFDAWTSETIDVRCVAEKPREIGQNKKPGFGVSYVAKVRVQIGDVSREGFGAGHGIDVDLGLAHESAIKEAETDARKRAFMTFGNPFGLALYDKEQRNVESSAPPPPPQQRAPSKPTLAASNGRVAAAAALRDTARAKAQEGSKAFDKWWITLNAGQRDELDAIADELGAIGHAADDAELLRAG